MNLKIITITIAIILILSGAFYISLQKDTEVLIIEVTLIRPPDDDSAKIISNVSASLSYARKMELPEDTLLETPGITVMVLQNLQEKSAWHSIPLPVDKSIYGDYTITVRLSNTIDHTQPVRILTRVVDPLGRDVSVRSDDVMLS